MGDVVNFDKFGKFDFNPSDYKTVHQRIKYLWNRGTTKFTRHARIRMQQRNIDAIDIEHVILRGIIIHHRLSGDYWRFKLEGKSADDDIIACIVEITDQLIVITVME